MTIAYLPSSSLPVLCLALTVAACSSSSKQENPDAPPDVSPVTDVNLLTPPDVSPATDVSLVTPPDGPASDAGGDAQGETAGAEGRGIDIHPSSATFTAAVGQTSSPVTFSITNVGGASIGPLIVTITGSSAADFAATTAGCDLVAPLGTCSITVVFTPKVARALETATLVVTGPGPELLTGIATLTGNVLTGARLVMSPTSAHFGTSGPPIVFGVANIGDTTIGPLTVTITGPNAAAFTATSKGCDSLAPLGTCTITVVYTPSLEVDPCATDSLVVTGPAPELVTVSATLHTGPGSTPNPLVLTSTTSDLGSVAVGTTGPSVAFTLSYIGDFCSGEDSTGPFTIELLSAEFVITDNTCSTSVLPIGGTCTFGVALRPTSAGDKLTNVLVTPQTGLSAVTKVTGTGVAIDASITPPDGAVLDASSEAQGEAGQAG